MRLSDVTNLRNWKYSVTTSNGHSGPWVINENLTGAVLGDQRPARISFRTALLIVEGWNRTGGAKYFLVIPNPA